MYTGKINRTAKQLRAVATVGCVIFAGHVLANDPNVTVTLRVSAAGLDLSRPADVRTFYSRLTTAAKVVCTHGNRVDLLPADDQKGCYEKALADAVRSVKVPMLTQIYLANHTVRSASTGWSYVPVPVEHPITGQK
jgi:UrcA family protein